MLLPQAGSSQVDSADSQGVSAGPLCASTVPPQAGSNSQAGSTASQAIIAGSQVGSVVSLADSAASQAGSNGSQAVSTDSQGATMFPPWQVGGQLGLGLTIPRVLADFSQNRGNTLEDLNLKWVFNLSSKPLTQAQRSVLPNGPNSVVSPRHPLNLEYITATESLCTKLVSRMQKNLGLISTES